MHRPVLGFPTAALLSTSIFFNSASLSRFHGLSHDEPALDPFRSNSEDFPGQVSPRRVSFGICFSQSEGSI